MSEAVLAGPRTALAVRGLSKTYAGTLALDSLFMQIRPGEVHALLGGNGSGKSTTIKILAGVVPADPGGEISIGDESVGVSDWNPARAHAAGLRFVHQQPAVFLEMTVAENQAKLANMIAYAPTNPAAFKSVDPKIEPWLSTAPANVQKGFVINEDEYPLPDVPADDTVKTGGSLLAWQKPG